MVNGYWTLDKKKIGLNVNEEYFGGKNNDASTELDTINKCLHFTQNRCHLPLLVNFWR